MKQLIQFEHELYQQTTMKEGDWVPISVRRAKENKPELSSKEVEEAVTEFLNKHVTRELLERGIEEACEGSFEKKRLPGFLQWINRALADREEELKEKNIKWKDVSKRLGERCREFFFQ